MKNDMTNERINILIASDINYAPYYGVMLTSLFENNKDSKFDIHLLTDSTWTDKESAKFKKLVSKHDSDFHVHIVDEKMMENFPLGGHLTLPTYYNLCAAELLPQSIHRIIYMDGDMIVNGDIRPLWELDLRGKACAMVPNCTYFDESYYERLGYDSRCGYYNNGTTVYDFDYLREMDFSSKALALVVNHPDKMKWMDQDAQNAILHDKIHPLCFKYNFQTIFFAPDKWNSYNKEFRINIQNAALSPVIIHYNGKMKPWQYQYYLMPYGKLWNKYRRMSLWKDCAIRKPRINYVKHLLKRVLKHNSLVYARNKEFIPESLRFS